MNTLKTIAASITVSAVTTLGLGWVYIHRTEAIAPAHPVVQVCEEDQPCWDCTTMGNRICGHPPMDYGLPTNDESPVVLR